MTSMFSVIENKNKNWISFGFGDFTMPQYRILKFIQRHSRTGNAGVFYEMFNKLVLDLGTLLLRYSIFVIFVRRNMAARYIMR